MRPRRALWALIAVGAVACVDEPVEQRSMAASDPAAQVPAAQVALPEPAAQVVPAAPSGEGSSNIDDLLERAELADETTSADRPVPRHVPRHRGIPSTSTSVPSAPSRPARHRSALWLPGPGQGGFASPAAPIARAALPQNGVLTSSFVGGSGVSARLDDLLDRGVLVDGQHIRLEAFQDRARLPYAVPAREAVAMYAELERDRMSASGDRVHLQVTLVAKQGEAPPRPRMDVRLVLDRSGSMQGDNWESAVAAAHALVDRLDETDTFGLVSYADSATIDLAPARLGTRARAHRAIDSLAAGGATNIGAALEAVAASPPHKRAPSDVALVVLVSDGQATVGQTNPSELGRIAREMFDAHGVLTTSIGLGTDFDEETMLTIAREGSGSYQFVRRAADIDEILTDELESRLQSVAQALRVRVVLGPGVVAQHVYGSRLLSDEEHAQVRTTEVATDARLAQELGITRNRRREEDEGLRIHIPTFRRGDQHAIVMELSVPGGRARSLAGVARVLLDYKDLATRQNAQIARSVTAERTSDRESVVASTRRTVKRTVLAFQAGDALQRAADSLATGDADAARRALAERRAVLEAAASTWRDRSLAADASMLSRYERVLAAAWPSWGSGERQTLVLAMNYFGDRRMR